MNKLRTVSRFFINAVLAAVLFTSCGYVCGYSVEQEVREMKYSPETKFVTYVWGSGKIVQAWYDPIDSVNSALVKRRQVQADSLIAALKNSR
jgi:hypothetical protein